MEKSLNNCCYLTSVYTTKQKKQKAMNVTKLLKQKNVKYKNARISDEV